MPRYLTKSRFKLALQCPTKLYYTGKIQYPDLTENDPFMEALAEGGFQVGELAKCYFPGGIDIKERGYEFPLNTTKRHLEKENVTLFEAAFKFKNLFIRADIINKRGNRVDLIEVKAKSFGGNDSSEMLNKKEYLASGWKDYVYDVAFQNYVLKNAYPEFTVLSYLMLANKNAVATVDGLNQKFKLIQDDENMTTVKIVGDVSFENLGEPVLIQVNVDDIVERIFDGTEKQISDKLRFVDSIHYYANMYERDEKIITPIHKDCKTCEFKTNPKLEAEGKISGFKECWSNQLGWTNDKFAQPLILDIWDYRSKQKLMNDGVYLMKDITQQHIGNIAPNEDESMSRTERQWMQVRKTVDKDHEPYVDIDGLKMEFDSFKYPLHFIDFETSMVAIPFFKGRRPYEQVAFQFSHHIVDEDLSIEHKGQYLCEENGLFPNIEFIRNLKQELEGDGGTIFRYADHENTVLNQILAQLEDMAYADVPDKDELIAFIKTISHGANHHGERDMIDMRKLVLKYYYHALMGGSNSIKAVLPAVLESSQYIQQKYSQPVYGKNSPIRSLNFDDGWIWIKKENNQIISPYKLLPPLFEGINDEQIQGFLMRSNIKDGGAAMTAYAKMQFTNISELEKRAIIDGLYKYCELDTLAMVMIWECFNKELS
jgi:hypothetical protein